MIGGCCLLGSLGDRGDGGRDCVWSESVPDICRIGRLRCSLVNSGSDPLLDEPNPIARDTGGVLGWEELPFPECEVVRLKSPDRPRLTDGLSCAVALLWKLGFCCSLGPIVSFSAGLGGGVTGLLADVGEVPRVTL